MLTKPISSSINPCVMALAAAAGILLALSPSTSRAQNNTAYGSGALQSGTQTGLDDSAFGVDALYQNTVGSLNRPSVRMLSFTIRMEPPTRPPV